MTLLASILLFALTRAEMIDRLAATPTVVTDGLVKVVPDCPSDMRKEYQQPISRFANDTMEFLYQGRAVQRKRFSSPGIIIYIGDERLSNTNVVSMVKEGSTRIYLPAPGFADINKFKLELVKGFALALEETSLDDEGAIKYYRFADPILRVIDERESLEKWLEGDNEIDDEEGLKLLRKVVEPGKASVRDFKVFASRLYLYPMNYSAPFLGKYSSLSFADAIMKARTDPAVRLAAYKKSVEVIVYGGGKGEKLQAASEAYSKFLSAFAAGQTSRNQLVKLLSEANTLLHLAREEINEKDDNR